MFAERSLTPRSDFSVDDDDDNSDTSSVAFNAVQYAIELVHEAAAPHASAAQAVMHDYDCVANLCRACLPNGAYQDLCAALRTIVMAANKQQRYAHMCQVGLPHAFKALFEYLSSHFCGTAAGAPAVWTRRLRLSCSAFRAIADSHRSFYTAARMAGVCLPVSQLLKNVHLQPASADALCGVLSGLLKGQKYSLLLDCHSLGCTTGLVIHYRNTPVQQLLLMEMLRCYSSCRSILRCQMQGQHIVSHLCMSIESGGQEGRASAVKSLCLLLDGDIARCSAFIAKANSDFGSLLLTQLSGTSTRCGALQIIQCTLGSRKCSFDNQLKSAKLPGRTPVAKAAVLWAEEYAVAAIEMINHALLETCANEAHAAGCIALHVLMASLPRITLALYRDTLNVLRGSFSILIRARDGQSAARVLKAIAFAAHGAGMSVEDIGIAQDLQSLQQLCPSAFAEASVPTLVYCPEAPGGDCSICTAAYDTSETIAMRLHCNHVFCASCLRKWIVTSNNESCPACRNEGINIADSLQASKDSGGDIGFYTRRHLRESDFE
jgi:hypothetical protein